MKQTTVKANGDLIRRATELDALEAILPFNRRDQLAGLLTDDDVATLKHLAQEVRPRFDRQAADATLGPKIRKRGKEKSIG